MAISTNGTGLKQSREQVRADYEKATKGLIFTKDFQTRQEAVMHDRLATVGERVMAWILRRSWGQYALYAVTDSGEPAFQRDCAQELGIDKKAVSHAVAYYRKRGYLEIRGKFLYPVISPALSSPDPDPKKSEEYATFFEQWKVANSSDFQELEVARSTIKRITKVVLTEYKKFRQQATKAGASLLETNETNREEPPSISQPSPEVPPVEVHESPPKPAGRPEGGDESILKSQVREYLSAFAIPDPLTPLVVREVAQHITTENQLHQFKEATAPDRIKPRKWIALIRIAEQVARDGPRYEQAKANEQKLNGPRISSKTADFARRWREEHARADIPGTSS